MQLSEIFTKKNIEILKLIDQEELHIREIADRLKISPGLVHKLTTILKKQDLIIETRIKNKKLIKFNKENPKIGLIMDIINDTEENTYLKKYKHLLKRRWYIQSFNATPTLIHLGGMSIPIMKKDLGYSYRFFMNNFKEDFCEMYYDRNDLHMIAHEVEDRMMINPEYINKLIQTWKKRCKKMELFIKKNENDILIKKFWRNFQVFCFTIGVIAFILVFSRQSNISFIAMPFFLFLLFLWAI
ncbi:MAG: winged helix-turn-helix domain-containing protein, partial [Nanoarchaeota archaeon]|nr:winged helix-turn-helix domain-containing protein [Nanoarchaeota archaeon]